MDQRHSRLLMILWEHCFFERRGEDAQQRTYPVVMGVFGEIWLASTLLLEKGMSLREDEEGRPKSRPQTATKEPEHQTIAMCARGLVVRQYMEPVVYFGICSL